MVHADSVSLQKWVYSFKSYPDSDINFLIPGPEMHEIMGTMKIKMKMLLMMTTTHWNNKSCYPGMVDLPELKRDQSTLKNCGYCSWADSFGGTLATAKPLNSETL